MKKLRKGDIVSFKAVVLEVADYSSEGQQIQAKLLPKGITLSWCVPQENEYFIEDRKIKAGDEVRSKQNINEKYTVLYVHERTRIAFVENFITGTPYKVGMETLERC